jgi:hypothetical protein
MYDISQARKSLPVNSKSEVTNAVKLGLYALKNEENMRIYMHLNMQKYA